MEPCSNYLGMLDRKYILVKEIDSNSKSTTYKAFNSFTEKEFLAKIINKNDILLNTEIKISKKISENGYPFFLKYINSSRGDFIMDEIKEYNINYILFEYANKGNLLQYVNIKRRGFDEKICKVIFAKILKAIQVLHGLGICVKNIDLKDILLDGEIYNLKLSNFEFYSFFNNEKGEKILIKEKVKIGHNIQNMAPEVGKGIPYDGEKADIFSLGILLFSLITGFNGLKGTKASHSSFDINEKLYMLLKKNKIESFWNFLEKKMDFTFSSEFKKLFIKMVAINPDERPTIGEIYKYEWMNEINKLSEKEIKIYEQDCINELKNRNEILNLLISSYV